MKAEGWAIVENGGINVRTVSPTRRAAIVNWLCTEVKLLALNTATDVDIERMWEANKRGAETTKVVVTDVE